MDRLLYKEADGDLTCRARDFEKIFPALYAYEETGFTPDDIKTLEGNYDALHDENEALRAELEKVKAELVDERHRHDRYVDFELAEAEELSRYKKADSEGRLVIMPCRSGGDIWILDGGVVIPAFAGNIHVNPVSLQVDAYRHTDDELIETYEFDEDDFGKTVFLTKEEAIAALAKDNNVPGKKED